MAPLLTRIVLSLLGHPHPQGVDPRAWIESWLATSEVGRQWIRYFTDEAELLTMAANRLNLVEDEHLREIARELGRSADRLRTLSGASDADRVR